jgi:hypothetical protein
MRKNNPARADPCNCEHVDHFATRYEHPDHKRTKHRYMKVPAGEEWGYWVGHICDDCAATCMEGWVVEHEHGTGDCHRQIEQKEKA